jgi:hypothetical protein
MLVKAVVAVGTGNGPVAEVEYWTLRGNKPALGPDPVGAGSDPVRRLAVIMDGDCNAFRLLKRGVAMVGVPGGPKYPPSRVMEGTPDEFWPSVDS